MKPIGKWLLLFAQKYGFPKTVTAHKVEEVKGHFTKLMKKGKRPVFTFVKAKPGARLGKQGPKPKKKVKGLYTYTTRKYLKLTIDKLSKSGKRVVGKQVVFKQADKLVKKTALA